MRQELLPKVNATCKLCGTAYYVCVPCLKNRDRGIYGWKLNACSQRCFQIMNALDMYKDGMIDKNRVEEVLASVTLPEDIIAPYNTLYSQATGKSVAPVVKEEAVEEPVQENQGEKPVVEKSQSQNYYHKKNKHGKK